MTSADRAPTAPHAAPHHNTRYYDLVMTGFVTVLLCSNLIGPGKVCQLSLPFALPFIGTSLVFGAGNIFFPIGFIFGDILTEVYGYARARRVIWAGFGAMIFATLMSQTILNLPPKLDEPYNAALQPALEVAFGNTWRIVIASLLAYWLGDFANSYVLARMKVWMQGRQLWMRTIGSTIVGQGVDSIVFYPLAFGGLWTGNSMLSAVVFNFSFKVMVEVLATPITYAIIGFLKRAENVDHYDRGTDFNPFTLKD
jgi:queuosine precursor transporter